MFKCKVKGTDGGYKLSELLPSRGGSPDKVVNVTAVEFRFGAEVLTKKMVFDETYRKIGVVGSHFSGQGYAISYFVVIAPNEKQLSVSTCLAGRRSVLELGSLTVR